MPPPPEHVQVSKAIRQYLFDQQDHIIENWRMAAVHDETMATGHQLTRTQFLDHIPQIIRLLGDFLVEENNDPDHYDRKTRKHGHQRWQQGFKLKEVIRDWGHFNTVLVRSFEDFFNGHTEISAEIRTAHLLRLIRFTNDAFSSSVGEYDQMRQAEALGMELDLKSVREEFEAIIRSRGEMLRNVMHDLRGGLNGVAGASMVLDNLSLEHDKASAATSMLAKSVRNVREMLDSLLDLARLDSGREEIQLETLDVQEIVQSVADACQSVASNKGLELVVKGPPKLVVPGDRCALRRITQNLVTNAIAYTDAGRVTVGVRILDDDHWQLVVEDTGRGLQIEKGVPLARQLDTPFQTGNSEPDPDQDTTKAYQGEGIGLTIVKRFCELLHGTILLESEPGQGATFRIDFPRSYPEVDSNPEAPSPQIHPPSAKA